MSEAAGRSPILFHTCVFPVLIRMWHPVHNASCNTVYAWPMRSGFVKMYTSSKKAKIFSDSCNLAWAATRDWCWPSFALCNVVYVAGEYGAESGASTGLNQE